MAFFRLLVAVLLLTSCATATPADELDWLAGESSASASAGESTRSMPLKSLRKAGGALAVVLGGFFLFTVLMRKNTRSLPVNELMEPLGSVQIAPKVRLHLVRLGGRILVLHLSGQNVQRVAELEDPEEVQQLLSARKSNPPASVPVSVSTLLQTVEQSSPQASRGFQR